MQRFTMNNQEETVSLDGSTKSTWTKIKPYIPSITAFGLLLVLLGLYGLVYLIDSTLPAPLSLRDEVEKTHADAFITERARRDLKSLTEIGPRVVGSHENEVVAVDFLKGKIDAIIKKAHTNQKIEFDLQVVTGSHYLDYKPQGKFVPYSNLQNVVVKLYGANDTSPSVLINAHFDSVPTSPGGSDDGINVAAMLEILRKVSKEPQRPLNNLVFLFNGAEETCLQAAHGFITQHKWAKECKVVLNMEAAGAGGKLILFQSGPSAPWLLNYYSKVPHPYGQAAGEEIFQTNLVPSDTDFRIFRDYGGLVGLDMAFFKNGYRYHTKYDDLEHIPLGSFQHAGDNVLSLVRSLGNASEVAKPKENPGKIIFFDFLGCFMISYSETVAYIVNSIVVILSFVISGLTLFSLKLGYNRPTIRYLALTFGAIVGGWIIAGLFVAFLAFLIDQMGYSMSWYTSSGLIFGLYVAPTLALSSILLPFINHQKNIKLQMQTHFVSIIWTVILLFGTILSIRAMYALLIPVLFNCLGFVIIYVFKHQHTVKRWPIIYLMCLVIPTIFLMYGALTALSLFIPISGRTGSNKNPDLIVGMLSLFFTIIITSPFVALVSLVKNFKYLLISLGVVFVLSFIIMFTPVGFPYTGNPDSPAAERYWILHTQRAIRDTQGVEITKESGYFLLNMDRHSPNILKNTAKDILKAESVHDDCEKYLLCGLPLVHSKMVQIVKLSTWIPAGQPLLPEQTHLDVSKRQISPNVLRYNLTVIGPDRLGVYLSPKSGVKVLNISLSEKMPSEAISWNGRDLYFILHIYGREKAPLRFTFDVKVPANVTDVTTEVAVAGIFVHDKKNQKTPEYTQFLSEFPDWADVTAWLGSYESQWI